MPAISITIKNLPQIKAAFGSAPRLMARELNLAIRKTVLTIEADSKRNTPVRTGRLRASTYDRFSNLKGEVGTNTDYDRFVHEGTRFMKGRPYLRMAVQSNESNTDRFFTDAVNSVLVQIGKAT